jgi:hypothetical protein
VEVPLFIAPPIINSGSNSISLVIQLFIAL